MAQRTDVAIIGAGQAGLAVSRCLSRRGIDHVVLERGRIGQRWTERRPGLRLLTPNWMTRLPGHRYDGPDPDGFLRRDEVLDLLRGYAAAGDAPVVTGVDVRVVRPAGGGYGVITDRGDWTARAVVVATGACQRPGLPRFAPMIDRGVHQAAADRLTDASELPDGGVLVVGSSATGLQIADEIARAGRPVTLAVGRHVRVPRRYRGRDIFCWLDACGLLTEARRRDGGALSGARPPSFQLVGGDTARDLDLGAVAAAGARVVGRAIAASGTRIGFADSLPREVAAAEERLTRLLDRIDAHIAAAGLAAPAEPRPAPIVLPSPPREIDLGRDGIRSVVWATGYSRDYGWLDVPVLRRDGEIDQEDGITPAPGLFALGLPFMRRRNSTFIDGVGADAEDLADSVAAHLGAPLARAA